MSSLFSETVTKAISVYRQLLRRYLPQVQRVKKLAQLKLKNPTTYENDVSLYQTALAIVRDIEENMEIPEQGYYSYSGIATFCDYLKDYLSKYEIESGQVIHRAQKASRALIQAIQLAALPVHQLTEDIAKQFANCNEIIAMFGSDEQHRLHMGTLEKQRCVHQSFYETVITNFKNCLSPSFSVESEA
jgi:hypothetical protein